ncbi:hypothetical protein RJ639_000568 [Escallonia herrerae]|uniref:Uncharacterized protein n=1 Tax=Escallonia herrerae TaxID=1293975 RepID=A0AA88XCI2_9ASTE|nr:hypothetical protein RJ639_000568 [Escallonia herrerae]
MAPIVPLTFMNNPFPVSKFAKYTERRFVSIVPIRRTSQLVRLQKADSPAKRARQSEKRRVYNKAKKYQFKTWMKKLFTACVLWISGHNQTRTET